MHVIVMAGGGGTRLWPVSRQSSPKQIQPFIDSETLMQKTVQRVRRGFGAKNILVACGKRDAAEVRRQLPFLSSREICVEPERRDTGVGLAHAVVRLYHKNPETVFVNVNSDAYVKDEKGYIDVLKHAERAIAHSPDRLILIGVNPTYPETGYGYIKMGEPVDKSAKYQLFHIDRFVEKPDRATARTYIASWRYLWNPTLIVGRADTFLRLWKEHRPSHYASLMRIEKAIGSKEEKAVVAREFRRMKPISIDYAILEKAKNMVVMPADFGWADIGNWRTVADVLQSDKTENITKGETISVHSSSSLIYNLSKKQIVTTVGIENMVVIVTDDAVLVCSKNNAQDVKKVVEELQKRHLQAFL